MLLIAMALISDLRAYRIDNRTIVVFLLSGLLTNLMAAGLKGIFPYVLAALLPVVILFILFALRMLGAGDIKLFCAIGAIMGLPFVLYCMAFSFLSGGVIAVFILLFSKNLKERSHYLVSYLKTCFLTRSLKPYSDFSQKKDGTKFRFSIAIACGSAVVLALVSLSPLWF